VTRVAVVGGGLAGLAAALSCADAGADVVLLESRPRLGGATWSFTRRGRSYDNGQHVFLRCCSAYRSFLDRLGVDGLVRLQPRLDIPVLAGSGTGAARARLRRSPRLPAPLHLAPALARYRHVPLAQRARLLPAVLALRGVDPRAASSDEQTFGSWLAAHGQGDRAVSALWDLITLPTVNLPAAEASLSMAAKVFRTGLLEQADASDLGWASVPLGELHGDAAARALAGCGAEVRLRQPVADVLPRADGVTVRLGSGEAVEADAAVVAVPHDRVAALLPAGTLEHQDGLAALGTSPIVNVAVVLDRAVTDDPVFAVLDSPLQWVFDHTDASGTERGQVLVVSLSAATDALGRPSDELVADVVAELRRLLGRAAHAEVVDAVVSRQGAATFRAAPGSAKLRPGVATGHPRLFVAGAWTDTGWPATMEGAVRSGTAAAAGALGAVGAPARSPEEVSA
jgi:squalene-associated FAD-dependent desaturase